MEDVNLVIKILQERSAEMKGDINAGQGLDLMADAATQKFMYASGEILAENRLYRT